MVKKRGLHRGLDALISRPGEKSSRPPSVVPEDGELKELSIELLKSGVYQPRKVFDDDSLEELAASIKAQGVIQPIVVRKSGENYEIIAGERRWRAAQMAGHHRIPCLVKDIANESAIAMSLIENIQREDLNPIEEASALKRLMDEFHLTQQQAAEAVGKSRTALANLLRLLGLTQEVKEMLERGDLEMGHARALLSLDDSEQVAAAKVCVSKAYSVRETERYVRKLSQEKQHRSKAVKKDANIQQLENRVSEKIGARTNIVHGAKGKGKIVIEYSNLDVLEGILKHMGVNE